MRVGRGARRVRRYGASGVKRSGGRHWRALRSELPVRGREPQRREVPHVPPSGASLSPARRSASQRTALLLSTCIGAVWRVSGPAQAGRRAPNWPPVHADGAAVFALLQRSSLRRRLALTLEGEAGIQRSRRGLPRRRLHRVAAATRVRPAGLRPAVRPGDGHRGDRRRRWRGARRQGLHAGASGHARALSGGPSRP